MGTGGTVLGAGNWPEATVVREMGGVCIAAALAGGTADWARWVIELVVQGGAGPLSSEHGGAPAGTIVAAAADRNCSPLMKSVARPVVFNSAIFSQWIDEFGAARMIGMIAGDIPMSAK